MPVNLGYRAYQILWAGLDYLYPPDCGGCEQRGMRWCNTCHSATQVFTPPLCRICGQSQPHDGICGRCRREQHSYTALRSWAVFGDQIRAAIHKLKYKRDVGLGEALSKPMIQALLRLDWHFDVILPVPLGLARLQERGYNQAALLARPIALFFQVPYQTRFLKRVRETRSQVGLSLSERIENVSGAFQAYPQAVAGKNMLVIDDVTTSGSTLDACAHALIESGANRVYGFTLARAVFSNHNSTNDGEYQVSFNEFS